MSERDSVPLVLVADDEADVRALARRLLESWGYRVMEAGDGIQAVDLAVTERPHLILLDVRMPRMSGFDVLHRLRTESTLAFTPVVLLTGLSGSDDRARGIRLGADDFLTKPLDVVMFQARVKSLVKRELYRREADELRRNFTAMIVHDIRNPLNVVHAFAELLQSEEEQPDPEFVKSALERIISSSDRALELATQMLDLSQLEAGRVQLFKRREDVTTLLRSIAEDQKLLAHKKRIRFDVHLDAGLEADIDPRKLSEAIVNLLTNAIKFTPDGGNIALVARERPTGGILVEIADTGPGIPADQIGTLFAPWKQGKSAPSVTKGYGLGLAISRMVVEAHGGNIRVESEQGSGTTFKVELPTGPPTTLHG